MSSMFPGYYETINLYNAHLTPSTVHVKNTALAQFLNAICSRRL